tara:strand:+ start:269 stop:463 length:195 start_codon:yes stop_codon:yes gene_type:complete
MCKPPKVEQPKLPPPPPAVLEQVSPEKAKSNAQSKQASGTKKYRTGGLSIGGVKKSPTGIGIGS